MMIAIKTKKSIVIIGLILMFSFFLMFCLNDTVTVQYPWRKLKTKNKYVLVTGAAGFIGYHVVMRLLKENISVIGIDNFNDYYNVSFKYKRANHSKVVLNIDVCDSESLMKILSKYKVSHVVHLAAQAGVRYSVENPKAYIRSNIECFVSLLECIKNFNIPLIYASSSSVYGNSKNIPYQEDDAVTTPVSMYAATKRENELIAHVYWSLYKQRSVGLRFFTVYGPFGRPDMAYFSFTKNIFKGSHIMVYKNGILSRDFTYIDDIVDGIMRCIDVFYTYEILNLGRGEPHSVRKFISTIEIITGKSANIIYSPIAKGEVLKTFADISKAKKAIGYSPKVSLYDGLRRFVQWYNMSESR